MRLRRVVGRREKRSCCRAAGEPPRWPVRGWMPQSSTMSSTSLSSALCPVSSLRMHQAPVNGAAALEEDSPAAVEGSQTECILHNVCVCVCCCCRAWMHPLSESSRAANYEQHHSDCCTAFNTTTTAFLASTPTSSESPSSSSTSSTSSSFPISHYASAFCIQLTNEC